jgi:hypothetical protein
LEYSARAEHFSWFHVIMGLELFADLSGIQAVTYPLPGDKGWVPAMGSAASTIADVIRMREHESASSIVIDPAKWTFQFSDGPLSGLFLETAPPSRVDLADQLENAREKINIFGLTRNFYARDEVRALLINKARQVPIRMYLMDPACPARVERYRIEPVEAAFEDPARVEREILGPLRALVAQASAQAGRRRGAGLEVYLYNFPCSFAIEEIDDTCRVMLYGHGRRGTEGPIMVFRSGTPYFDYFAKQIRWLEGLASGQIGEPWIAKGVQVRRLS